MAVIINGTSGITDVDGTAAAPAITGLDTDTGLYFTTNALGLSTAGTAALYINASQNVGIGTTSPSYRLHVNGGQVGVNNGSNRAVITNTTADGSDTGDMYLNGGGDASVTRGAYVRMYGNENATNPAVLEIGTGNAAGNYFAVTTNGGFERMRIDSSGNVGIGTSSPGFPLDVKGQTKIGQSVDNATISGTTNFFIQRQANDSRMQMGFATTPDAWCINTSYGSTGAIKPLVLAVGDAERMRIDSSGNVMIGVTSAGGARLNVSLLKTTSTLENMIFAEAYDTLGGITSTFRVECTPSSSPVVNLVARAGGASTTSALAFITRISGTEAERMRIDSSGYVTNGANGNSAGLVQGYQYYRLNAGYAGSNATGAQSIFGVGVTLVGSTVYEFEIVVVLTKSAGTTSHTVGLGFGGTATLNNIGYQLTSYLGSAQFTNGLNALSQMATGYISSVSNTTITTAITSAAASINVIIKGTVSINAGGTFIPQYTLSAAPGGAYTTQIGSYIKIAPLSASGSNTSIGAWA